MNSAPTSRYRAVVERLTIPCPFDIDALLAAVAEQRGRRIDLLAVELGTGLARGLLISTATRDIILYPQDVGPFLRRHLIATAVGHLLLDQDPPTEAGYTHGPPDPAPDAPIRRLLGPTTAADDERDRDAEHIATQLLASVDTTTTGWPAWISRPMDSLQAWHARHALTPLWTAVTTAVPHVRLPDEQHRRDSHWALYRKVIEIRDAQQALATYGPPDLPYWAAETAQQHHLSPADAAILVEAAALAAALDAHHAGHPPNPTVTILGTRQRLPPEPNVYAEARSLIHIARVIRRDPLVAQLRRRARTS